MPTEIPNIDEYNINMSKSMKDKLFFLSELKDDLPDVIVDFGCADGELLKQIFAINPNIQLLGYDCNVNEIKKARKNFPEVYYSGQECHFFTIDWNCVVDNIKYWRNENKKIALVLSSVIHEVYSYCSADVIEQHWNLWKNLGFEYIIVRDMAFSTHFVPTKYEDVIKIRQKADPKTLALFEEYCGSIDFNEHNLMTFLLKYRYNYSTENFIRELAENYTPLSGINLVKKFASPKYSLIHYEHYTLPFLKDQVMKDFGVILKNNTHVKMILKYT